MKKHFKNLVELNIEPRPVFDDISVVIPTLGRSILEQCLYHIAAGTAWPGNLIVVDQGSSQKAEAWIKLLRSIGIPAEYFSSSQRGRSAAINRGLERVKNRFVAVTDDDCLVNHNWIKNMTVRLRQGPEAIFTGRVELMGNDEVPFSVVLSRIPKVYNRPKLKVHPLIGGNMGVAMANVERIGLFDEHHSINSAEDSDWGYRALRLGISIIYDPEIVVQHFHWRNEAQRVVRYREYSRSQGGFYGKYLFSGDWFIVLQATRSLLRGPVRWLRGLLKHDSDMIQRGCAHTLELLPGIIAGIKRERNT